MGIILNLIVILILLFAVVVLAIEEHPMWLVTSVSLIALFIFTMHAFNKLDDQDWVMSEDPYAIESIAALNDSNIMSGRIYMRHGYIEEDLYYQYMVELPSGGFKAGKVKSANATLYYTDENCRVEWYTRTKKWLYFESEDYYVKIYIPEGSISNEYSVDLE